MCGFGLLVEVEEGNVCALGRGLVTVVVDLMSSQVRPTSTNSHRILRVTMIGFQRCSNVSH